jgi:hypothetical protein
MQIVDVQDVLVQLANIQHTLEEIKQMTQDESVALTTLNKNTDALKAVVLTIGPAVQALKSAVADLQAKLDAGGVIVDPAVAASISSSAAQIGQAVDDIAAAVK